MTQSSTLKEEYAKKKAADQSRAFQEAKELIEAGCLIAEKLDTNTISRIVDSMTAVEDALGEFLPKLPSLKAGLDAAEAELSNLISGKGGNDSKKTGAMLGKAMAFYQGLSEFLRQDLPVLLKSRVMAQAKNQGGVAVGAKMAPAFEQALATEKTGGFLKRLFSSSNIPYVNNKQLAQELCTLTWNDLSKLSKVGQTPAVLSQGQIDQAAAKATGQAAPSAPSASGALSASSGAASSASGGGAAPAKMKEVEDFLRSTISGLMQGSPAANQVATQTAKKVLDILKSS